MRVNSPMGLTPLELPPTDGWEIDTSPAEVALNWAVADQGIPPVSLALAVRVAFAPAGRPRTVTVTGCSTSAASGDTEIDAWPRSRSPPPVHPTSPAAATSTITTGMGRSRQAPPCPAMATSYPMNRPTSGPAALLEPARDHDPACSQGRG